MSTEEVTEKQTGTECPICKGEVVEVILTTKDKTIIPGSRCCRDCDTLMLPPNPAPQILQ